MVSDCKRQVYHSSLAKTYLKDILKSVAKQYQYVTEAERVNIKVVKSLQLPKIIVNKNRKYSEKKYF